MIIWKIDKLKKYIENNKSRFETTIINMQDINKLLEFEETNDKKLFSLVIKKTEFNNKHIGYTFFFMREQQKFIEKNFLIFINNKMEIIKKWLCKIIDSIKLLGDPFI